MKRLLVPILLTACAGPSITTRTEPLVGATGPALPEGAPVEVLDEPPSGAEAVARITARAPSDTARPEIVEAVALEARRVGADVLVVLDEYHDRVPTRRRPDTGPPASEPSAGRAPRPRASNLDGLLDGVEDARNAAGSTESGYRTVRVLEALAFRRSTRR